MMSLVDLPLHGFRGEKLSCWELLELNEAGGNSQRR